MTEKFPKDCPARVVSTRAKSIFVYNLDAKKWEWHEQAGTDHRTDIIIELVEDGMYKNKKIEGQIKGRTILNYLKDGRISFGLDVKTVMYALGGYNPFVLFLVDVQNERVYYLPIQEYFLDNPQKFDDLINNKESISVHINPYSVMKVGDDRLCQLAKYVYMGGPGKSLRRIVDENEQKAV
ncbi:MAG: DUF4365 domain-containing protein [Lachnospiraceae bacterium]|nr:DUF4365 domain-containing protein [Lachnospiraceae bacterium]